MSRKVKPNKVQAKVVPPHAMGIEALVAEALAALNASRHKEAIELYKELLKRERRPEWVEGLASGYAGRAHELAAKSMFKEALVLWRNRTQLCGKPLAGEHYFIWLLQAGERGEMFRLLDDKTLSDAQRVELETLLAPIALAAAENTLPGLPADSALLRHRTLILEALAAYQRGDFAVMGDRLQAIPIRSPYRDLKPILKALILLHTDAEAAKTAIARLPSNGSFERLAAMLRAAILPEGRWLTAMRDLDDDNRHLLLDIKGCPDVLRPLMLELAKLGDSPAAAPLLELLLRHRRAMPESRFSRLINRLLPHLGQRLLKHAEFVKLPEEKKHHLMALTGELLGESEAARTDWKQLANLLSNQPEQKLREALIWRHVTDLCDDSGVKCSTSECLKRSLELDPEDRDSTLKVIRLFRSSNDLPQARTYLDHAQTYFPKDAGILLEAVEVALAGKAYKKAVGLAKQVLELDPINPHVRWLIGRALFSHARKQIKSRNFSAAQKELDASVEWLRSPTELAKLKLLRALASEHPEAEVNAQLREAMVDLGGTLTGAFHLLLETNELGLNPKTWLQRCGFVASNNYAPQEVVALAHFLNTTAQGESKKIREALVKLRAPLKRAAIANYSEADHLLICEALQQIEENELLVAYAESALKRWPGRPELVYLRAKSRFGDNPYEIPFAEIKALEKAAEEAKKQGDQRTASRIKLLLDDANDYDPYDDDPDDEPYNPFTDASDDGMPNPFDDFPGDPQMMFELLLTMHGEKAFLDLVRNALGKNVFNELKNQFGGDQKNFIRKLISMMIEDAASIRRKSAHDSQPPPVKLPPPVKTPAPKKPRPPSDIQKDLFDD